MLVFRAKRSLEHLWREEDGNYFDVTRTFFQTLLYYSPGKLKNKNINQHCPLYSPPTLQGLYTL
jgi:hypothetical protein